MGLKEVVPGVYQLTAAMVNQFLIDHDDRLTLIDTGMPGSTDRILKAVQSLGKQPEDLAHILLTHCHADHTGSLAALKAITGAVAYMHPADALLTREGLAVRGLKPGPGAINYIFWLMLHFFPGKVEAATIEHEPADGDIIDIAGGIKAIHAPGHCVGQLVYLWPQHGGVLFVADAANNMMGLRYSIVYENLEEGKRSLARIARLDYAVACFGHGRAIVGDAAQRFREKWG